MTKTINGVTINYTTPCDFKSIKSQVTAHQVMELFGIELKPIGDHQLRGVSPLRPDSDNPTSFSLNTQTGGWRDFPADKSGSLLDLTAELLGSDIRTAALYLQEAFGLRPPSTKKKTNIIKYDSFAHIDYLNQRQLPARQIASVFQLGSTQSNPQWKDYMLIPIHDVVGSIVGYSGRRIGEGEPRYMLSKGLKKSELLYNAHRIKQPSWNKRLSEWGLAVVEGFVEVWVLHILGFPAVSLMGCSASEKQLSQIVKLSKKVVLLLDADEPGRKGCEALSQKLSSVCDITIPQYPDPSKDLDDYPLEVLRTWMLSLDDIPF